MKVFFRVDSSARIGAGHLMRCLTLAEALRGRGVQIQFICREHAGHMIALLQQKGMPVSVLPAPTTGNAITDVGYATWLGVSQAEDADQSIEAFGGKKPDWLVVDHYGLSIEWEMRLRSHVGKLMVIDDLANRKHDCDLLLDQNYSADGSQRYAGLVPVQCKILLGSGYALLKKDFKDMRDRIETRLHDLRRILVFFTAGDDQGETLKAMRGIELYGKADGVDVVTGTSNPNNAAIIEKCEALHWGYHCQIDYMPALIARADLAIGAGGSSNWERCALGVPALVTVLAENQVLIAQALDNAGVVHNLGRCHDLQAENYADALCSLNRQQLAGMSEKALALVDALGAERVADILLLA
ncbi:MAG: UDP-2,4-diacetamido-2,4,6-trideoxy-beta-L-altropyranose hydrolase [Gallionella sp.]|nr:UDP-2,4-diacetamido-2,4,6-trideoxy-beta-L-altropyranose hydrolase [Gallionella sp.]